MRTLILIVVTSLLVIIGAGTPVEELKYGDIIAFPHTKICGVSYTYKHYGIFLDKKRFQGQKDDNNIFHFTGPLSTSTLSGCIFGKIKPGAKMERENYLDDIPLFKENGIINEDRITKRITDMYKNCTWWWPFQNNCEHLATYVRYGFKISFQCGTDAARKAKNPHTHKTLVEVIKTQLEDKKIHEDMELDLDISEEGFCDEGCDKKCNPSG